MAKSQKPKAKSQWLIADGGYGGNAPVGFQLDGCSLSIGRRFTFNWTDGFTAKVRNLDAKDGDSFRDKLDDPNLMEG
jgi:hypothetical protein